MCIILNTAEYCNNTITQMKDILVTIVYPFYSWSHLLLHLAFFFFFFERWYRDDQFKDKIDLQKEADEYSDIIARGLKVLVSNLEAKLEPAMQTMARLPWGSEDGIVGILSFFSSLSLSSFFSAFLFLSFFFLFLLDFFSPLFLFSVHINLPKKLTWID